MSIELKIPDLKLSQLEEFSNELSEMVKELRLTNSVEAFANEVTIKATTQKIKELKRKQSSITSFMRKIKVRDKLIDNMFEYYEKRIEEANKKCLVETGHYIDKDDICEVI